MQKYHDEPKQYKGYLKSALARRLAPHDDQMLTSTHHPVDIKTSSRALSTSASSADVRLVANSRYS